MNLLSVVEFLAAIAGFIIFTVLVALLCRRALGVPVGWPRSIIVAGALYLASGPVLLALFTREGVIEGGRLVGRTSTAVVLLLIGTIMLFACALIVLVIIEVIVPTGSVGSPFRLLTDTRARARRGRRYLQVLGIITKHGLAAPLRMGGRRDEFRGSWTTARSLAAALSEAGVTFIKLGQTMSTRPDLIPEPYVTELARLQSDATPMPWTKIEPVLTAELPGPVEDIFAEVEHEPLATASIGQVHGARLADGTDVVIKIRRPGARAQVEVDLDIIIRLARRLERTTEWARALGAVRLARGFAESLVEELDYRVEAENAAAVAASLHGSELINVPAVHGDLSGPAVLIMDRVVGNQLGQAGDLLDALAGTRRAQLADVLLSEVLQEILFTGTFHADLHPGNIIVGADGRVTLLDFGSVGRLDQPSRAALGMLLLAVDRDDPIGATDALTDLLDPGTASRDRRRLERDVGQLVVRYRTGLSSGAGADMFAALWKLITSHRLAVPPQVGAAMRALAGLESSVRMINPEVDIVSAARGQGVRLVGEITDPATVKARVEGELFRILPVLQRLPQRLNRITDDLENGRFTTRLRVLSDPDDRRFLSRLVGQLSITLVAGAAVLSAMVLITSNAGPVIAASFRLYPLLGVLLLFFGLILGLRVIVVALRSFDTDP
ncbi:MAG: AarF/ABC1/UbiB kinase family protein [Microlunatus sp.]|nr:AarF/ABC1/UbiB kinase family protein [Microlunatus sp.]